MVFPIIRLSKFAGTIGLGLLTGVSYSLSNITLPSLLHLPTAPLASQTHSYIKSRSATIQKWLSTACTGAFIVAFALAPRRARHPYLLYTALVVFLGSSPKVVERIATRIAPPTPIHERISRQDTSELAESAVMVGQSSGSSEASDEEDINGEVVRKAVERNQLTETIRAGLYGTGFLLSVIGIWGDGV